MSKPCIGSTCGHSPDLYLWAAANPQSALIATKIQTFEFILEDFSYHKTSRINWNWTDTTEIFNWISVVYSWPFYAAVNNALSFVIEIFLNVLKKHTATRRVCEMTEADLTFYLESLCRRLPQFNTETLIFIHESFLTNQPVNAHSAVEFVNKHRRSLFLSYSCHFIQWVTKSLQFKENYDRSIFSLIDFSIDVRYFILIRDCRASSSLPDW